MNFWGKSSAVYKYGVWASNDFYPDEDQVPEFEFKTLLLLSRYIGCPTRYRSRHFFNNFTTGWRTAAPCHNN